MLSNVSQGKRRRGKRFLPTYLFLLLPPVTLTDHSVAAKVINHNLYKFGAKRSQFPVWNSKRSRNMEPKSNFRQITLIEILCGPLSPFASISSNNNESNKVLSNMLSILLLLVQVRLSYSEKIELYKFRKQINQAIPKINESILEKLILKSYYFHFVVGTTIRMRFSTVWRWSWLLPHVSFFISFSQFSCLPIPLWFVHHNLWVEYAPSFFVGSTMHVFTMSWMRAWYDDGTEGRKNDNLFILMSRLLATKYDYFCFRLHNRRRVATKLYRQRMGNSKARIHLGQIICANNLNTKAAAKLIETEIEGRAAINTKTNQTKCERS